MVAIRKISRQKQKKKCEGEDTSWRITRRANAPNGMFSTFYFAAVSLRIHVEFLNDERGRERQVMLPLVLWIKLLLLFISKFLFWSVGYQLATFARILVAKYFFHSPWWPKWSQLGALSLEMFIHVLRTVMYPVTLFSFSRMSVTCQRQDPVEGHPSVGW